MNLLSNKQNDAGVRDKLIFLFAVVSFCFPKAGTATAGLPLTVSSSLFLSALAANARELSKKQFTLAYAILFIIMGVSSIITVLLNLGNITAMNIAYILVLLSSPLTYQLGLKFDLSQSKKIVSAALIFLGSFSLVQWIFGVRETAVAGLTIAFGEDYAKKQIIREGIGISKIPSTYQNGTLLAPFLIIGIAFLLEIKNKTRSAYFAIVLGIIGLILSGSRSSIFAVVCILPVLLFRVIKRAQDRQLRLIVMAFSLLPTAVVLLALFSNSFLKGLTGYIFEIYIGFTQSDTTFSGRTVQWTDFISIILTLDTGGLFRFMFSGIPWNEGDHMEGLFLLMKLYGVTVFSLFAAFIVSFFRKFRRLPCIGCALLVLFVIFMIDGSVFYPPTLMNIFLILGMSKPFLDQTEIMENEELII